VYTLRKTFKKDSYGGKLVLLVPLETAV